MKTLVLCDDYWHPARVPREGLGQLTGTEFTFDWIENAKDWSPEHMLTYPLVILTKSNNVSATDKTGWMTDAVQAAFYEYVHKGNGLLAIHSGTAEYAQMPVLRSLLGGVFTHHPEQCPVTVTPRVGHPLSVGSLSFTLKDEHYFMALDDPQADVFVTTTSEHGEQPGGWRRVEGSGRVAVLGTLLMWTFIMDAGVTFIQRALKRENVFAAHRTHLYQRLVIGGYSHAAVSTLYIFLTMLAGLLSYAWSWGQVYAPPLIILGLPLIWILLSRHAKSLTTKDTTLAPGAHLPRTGP